VRLHREITLAFIAILVITGIYLGFASRPTLPESSGLIGHGIGIVGFLLMLATETLYSIRKRATRARWGRMQTWLQFHIFTGIVGPYLVLLHSAFAFRGLAGIVTLMMAVVVLSGFVGRYIYTAVPRTPEGAIVAYQELEQALADAERELQQLAPQEAPSMLQEFEKSPDGVGIVFGRTLLRWRANIAWRRRLRKADAKTREHMLQVDSLRKRRNDLLIQVRSNEVARRMLSVWHSVHVPIGISLFVAAFVHIVAALYYATLMR